MYVSQVEIDNELGKNDKLCSAINYLISPEIPIASMNAHGWQS